MTLRQTANVFLLKKTLSCSNLVPELTFMADILTYYKVQLNLPFNKWMKDAANIHRMEVSLTFGEAGVS